MDPNKIQISFINKGTYIDHKTGEIKPGRPRNWEKLSIHPLKQLWFIQTKIAPAPKGTNGEIFPFATPKFFPIEEMKKLNIVTNQVVFIDIDCGPSLVEPIFNRIEDINAAMGGSMIAASKTGKGIHAIFCGSYDNPDQYSKRACFYLTLFAEVVKRLGIVDLKEVPGALDPCTFSIKQRLYLRHSSQVFWTPLKEVSPLTMDSQTLNTLASLYPEFYSKLEKRSFHIPDGVKRECKSEVYGIRDVPTHAYIDHHQRWLLYDSLCCCYSGEELEKAWERCASLIEPGHGHGVRFFIEEPSKNNWHQRWIQSNSQYCNESLLDEFGYVIKNISTRDIVINNDWYDF